MTKGMSFILLQCQRIKPRVITYIVCNGRYCTSEPPTQSLFGVFSFFALFCHFLKSLTILPLVGSNSKSSHPYLPSARSLKYVPLQLPQNDFNMYYKGITMHKISRKTIQQKYMSAIPQTTE